MSNSSTVDKIEKISSASHTRDGTLLAAGSPQGTVRTSLPVYGSIGSRFRVNFECMPLIGPYFGMIAASWIASFHHSLHVAPLPGVSALFSALWSYGFVASFEDSPTAKFSATQCRAFCFHLMLVRLVTNGLCFLSFLAPVLSSQPGLSSSPCFRRPFGF